MSRSLKRAEQKINASQMSSEAHTQISDVSQRDFLSARDTSEEA